MNVQDIVSDVRNRVTTASQHSQDAFAAYVDAQRKAFSVVTRNGQSLANTEITAARTVFAAARTSFDRARKDGMRQVAQKPQSYVPNGRAQLVSAYKDTIDLLVKTGNELSGVVSGGYKSVIDRLAGKAAKAQKSTAGKTTARKTPAAKSGTTGAKKAASSSTQKTTAAKRKTAATRTRRTSAKSGDSSTKSAGTRSASTTVKKAASTTTS